ncbi:MAG: TonB-dependent siderophore receptor [Verrucomicrobia bacterium]|nr:TonB-dependent siderophore receptor [Verrucomicrobiota bacterium]
MKPLTLFAKCKVCCLLGGALLLPIAALAQATASGTSADDPENKTVRMNPFTVSQDAVKGYLATDTASGSKVAMKIIDMPQTLNVITREAMDDSGLSDPNALFEFFAPGVSNLTGPGIEGTNAVIRGFRAQNWAVNGATTHYLSQLVSDNFETIEVIKGPSVLMYGRYGGYGGYINVTMKTPKRTPVNSVQFGIGTANYYHGMVDYGQALGADKNFQYRVVISSENSDYPAKNYDYNKYLMIAPSIAYDISAKTRFVLRFEWIKSDQSWTPSQLDKNGKLVRAFSSNEAEDDMRNLDINRIVQATFTSQLSETWSLKLNTLLQTMSNDWKYTYGMTDLTPGLPAQFYVFTPNQRKYVQKSFYGDATLDWKVDDFGHGLSNDIFFNIGFDNFNENIKFLANNMLGSTNPRANPLIDPSNPDLAAMRYNFDYPFQVLPYVTQNTSGAAVSETFGLFDKKLQLVFRARYNYDQNGSLTQIRTPANNPASPLVGTPAATVVTEKTTMDWGAVYKPIPSWSLYYGHTEAYSPVATGFTVAGKALQPESGQDDEVGTKVDMQLLGGIVTGSIAYFSMDVSNKWRPDPFNPGYFVQDGDQKNTGVEGQIGYSNKRYSVMGGFYSADGPYQKNQPATGIQPAGNLRAVFSPKITYNLWAKYNITDSLSVGGGYRYQGDQVASTRLLISPGFGTTDLFASYSLKLSKGSLKFLLSCTNVSDGIGFTREDTPAAVYVQEGRRTKLTGTYSW